MGGFLRYHTKIRPHDNILKVSCHRESGKLHGGLLPSCFTGSASHGQASTRAPACAILRWSFGKYWFANLDRASRCWDILLHSIKKSDLLMSPTLSLDQSLSIIKFTVADTMFSKILIFNLKAQILPVCLENDKTSFVHVQEDVCQILKYKYSLCPSSFQVKMAAHSSVSQVLLLETTIVCRRSVMWTSVLSQEC